MLRFKNLTQHASGTANEKRLGGRAGTVSAWFLARVRQLPSRLSRKCPRAFASGCSCADPVALPVEHYINHGYGHNGIHEHLMPRCGSARCSGQGTLILEPEIKECVPDAAQEAAAPCGRALPAGRQGGPRVEQRLPRWGKRLRLFVAVPERCCAKNLNPPRPQEAGFSIVEILVVMTFLVMIIAGAAPLASVVFRGQLRTAHRAEALALVQEGLEAARSIRDADWQNLTDGVHGLSQSGGFWEFSGTQESIGEYTRSVRVRPVMRTGDLCSDPGEGVSDPDAREVTVEVVWPSVKGGDDSLSVASYLDNWRNPQRPSCSLFATQADWLVVDDSSAAIGGPRLRELRGIALKNSGTADIVIATLIVSWRGELPGTRILSVAMNGGTVWFGAQKSGETIDITDVLITPQAAVPIDALSFTQNLTGVSFDIVFVMADGSRKTVRGIQL